MTLPADRARAFHPAIPNWFLMHAMTSDVNIAFYVSDLVHVPGSFKEKDNGSVC